MKKTALASLLTLLVMSPLVRAQAPFEGTATWSLSIPQMDDEKHEMTINMKADKVETDLDLGAQGGIKTYLDRANKKVYIVMSAMKSGMVMDMPNDSVIKSKTEDIEVKSTGQKETVAGHIAEEYQIHAKSGEISMWMSADFPQNVRDAFHRAMGAQHQDPAASHAMEQLAAKGLVPVKMVVKNGGEIAAAMELVKLEPKKLDDSVFETPKDIKFSPMPTGMHGMN
ncbi:MAG: DUF4412 domain-containing protein [Bacteroidota bacterium]|nr:DUF4412 domain-containing protein [Bacteroidota bacterium]MDP4232192.1 DUF4412 domain-containing protein [Bacteroidota bacterium]MDP4243627.1 DUF4412 domain-containing protein [Bacteroidota bacterium]MDP4288719.1 DUF4412 domain-containing protein [Bacteroidota bacterium]